MKARLIQTSKLADDNKAEKELLEFLRELPEDYTVYRELRVNRDYDARMRGFEKSQPDFVVVGEKIGLLSIEVKDWNLTANHYHWRNQNEVIKEDVKSGQQQIIISPMLQADAYLYAFIDLLRDTGVWVTSILAFPRISRQAFLNKIGNISLLNNPQSKFFLNLEMTIFKEDIDDFFLKPHQLLQRIAQKRPMFHTANALQIEQVHERILPSAFRVGDVTKRQKERERLKMITTQQEKWIFDLDRTSSYLLDVAGSGKTNILVSRAVHIIDQAHKRKQTPPNVLLTTYNPNLQRNIEHILSGKIKPEERHDRYATLRIENIEHIMRRIAATAYGLSQQEYYKLNPPNADSFQKTLRDDVHTALQDTPDRYCVFDVVLIDEIQDFDDEQLHIIRSLARTDNFFFVGDIGQKIYDRYHDLKRHGFELNNLELPKSYKMYRTPRYIGELAYRFVNADATTRAEFEQHGYRQETQFASLCNNAAEVLRTQDPVASIVERIRDLLAAHHVEDDIMVITSRHLGPHYKTGFERAGIAFSYGEPKQSGHISLVEFTDVKGLEREVVLISGIEDLYNRKQGLFDTPSEQLKEEGFSRRKIYVALTRPTEECIVYYTDSSNFFVNELITINRKLISKRQQVS